MSYKYGYITEYNDKIQSGEIVAGEYIKTWYQIVVKDLDDGKWIYDEKKAMRCINFISLFGRHHEGALAPGRIKLELWQKAFLSVVFGIVDSDGYRRFREVLLQVGRKNGKTLLSAAIGEYMLYAGEYGSRCFFTAPKLQQA